MIEILPVELYVHETLSLTVRKGYSLKVFENRKPRRIFGTKKYKRVNDCRKLHDEELAYYY
jgi:hypothetical protein